MRWNRNDVVYTVYEDPKKIVDIMYKGIFKYYVGPEDTWLKEVKDERPALQWRKPTKEDIEEVMSDMLIERKKKNPNRCIATTIPVDRLELSPELTTKIWNAEEGKYVYDKNNKVWVKLRDYWEVVAFQEEKIFGWEIKSRVERILQKIFK